MLLAKFSSIGDFLSQVHIFMILQNKILEKCWKCQHKITNLFALLNLQWCVLYNLKLELRKFYHNYISSDIYKTLFFYFRVLFSLSNAKVIMIFVSCIVALFLYIYYRKILANTRYCQTFKFSFLVGVKSNIFPRVI